jgi:uncharacterized membrane protein YfcA
MDPALFGAFLVLGAGVGFLAGLFGIGGGLIIVPLLTLVFSRQGFPPEHVVHVAVATAMATILFTSVASMREHQRHGAIRWPVVAAMAPGIIVGSLAGPQIVGGMSTAVLSAFFGVFVAAAATNTLLDRKPKPTRELPGTGGMFVVGGGIGLVSSMVGAGGGFLSVPFMMACNINIRNCVATSAALGLPISLAGTIGFVAAGLAQPGMPPYTIGYVYVPAVLTAGAEAEARVRDSALHARGLHAVESLALSRAPVVRARSDAQRQTRCEEPTRTKRTAPAARSSGLCPWRCAAGRPRSARAWAP